MPARRSLSSAHPHQPGRWWCSAAFRAAARQSGRHGARTAHTSPGCPLQPAGVARGLQVSRGDVLENLFLKRQISNQALEPDILTLQLLHPLGLIELEPTIFLAPAIITLLRYAGLPARHRRRLALRQQTSIWRSSTTICSALNRFFGITKLLACPFSHKAWSKNPPAGHSPDCPRL